MKLVRFFLSLAVLFVASVFLIAPASAQATRTWVSGVGDDANPCSRTAPCKTFAGAISKTATSGEINCLDPGGFGTVTITKSITIDCKTTEGGVLSSLVNGVVVNTPAGSVVHLRGLDIDGAGNGLDGVRMIGQGQLHIEDSNIERVTSNGVEFLANGNSELYISNTRIAEAGAEGVLIKTSGAIGINAILSKVEITNSGSGILVDGTGNTLAMNMTLTNSLVSGNTGNGVTVKSVAAASSVRATIVGTTISANAGVGVNANGAAASGSGSAIAFLGGSAVFGNVTGVSNTGSGAVQSFKNNMISGNITDGTPITAFPGPGGTPLQ
ncbi:right-handed parallel beta-helix repeat-containing protein [Mesorhizobium sp. M1050]|uniref:right-handed parallel beta-helix repeat-containing protein n=1 Tax=unclassified Mesorhizobium TaxID=325217 RepID=UPI0003CEA429|nr:right-handed parallel beta-helix repeat-containing protein [Mesorhizobium sp. LNHC252B00]ESY72702.1 membrane protein [Mesorhizobium sp. LNHC252B00]